MATKRSADPEKEIDGLFRLPLSEFTAARNALAARLTKLGHAIEARRVKSLPKPPAPAWAVNQLYWRNAKTIDQLIALTERVRKAQTGRTPNANLRDLLDEKKKVTADLMEKASAILTEAGHSASPDAMRRVSATLEALAFWGNAENAPKAGRLTADLDPPGFDALAAVMGGSKIKSSRVLSFRPPPKPAEDPSAKLAAVKTAEKILRDAQQAAKRAQTALAKTNARTTAVERQKQAIDARYAEAKEEARAASNEAKTAAQAVADAERSLARAKEGLD